MKNKIFLTGFYLIYKLVLAQPVEDWSARYNGTGNEWDDSYSIALDGAGNIYVTGYTWGSGTYEDYTTIKYNSTGTQQWVANYNGVGNDNDEAYSIAVDGSGNVYVTGYSIGDGTGADYVTIKYNSTGTQQWATAYNGPGNSTDIAYSLVIDGSGNVYVTGYSIGSGTSNDYATIKYNSSGTQQWVTRYNGAGNGIDVAHQIVIDGSGNTYVTGFCSGTSLTSTNYNYLTVKYNSSGTEQWATEFDGTASNYDEAFSLAVDESGNVYVTGICTNTGLGIANYDYATVKYNSSGTQLWAATYDGPANNNDFAQALTLDATPNVYVTGWSKGNGTNWDYATIKYNSSGTQQWVVRYDGPANLDDVAYSLAVDGSGNVFVTGGSKAVTYFDYATVKYNSSGTQQWVVRYNGPNMLNDNARSVILDESGNIYVTGFSNQSAFNYDYATVKYTEDGGKINLTHKNTSSPHISQNFPNPFNPTTVITFLLHDNSYVKLTVYDILGANIVTLVDGPLYSGLHEIVFDGSDLTSGVYYYRLTVNGKSETKKMLLIK
jgi:uncharacterized delta-60 repeat protein